MWQAECDTFYLAKNSAETTDDSYLWIVRNDNFIKVRVVLSRITGEFLRKAELQAQQPPLRDHMVYGHCEAIVLPIKF